MPHESWNAMQTVYRIFAGLLDFFVFRLIFGIGTTFMVIFCWEVLDELPTFPFDFEDLLYSLEDSIDLIGDLYLAVGYVLLGALIDWGHLGPWALLGFVCLFGKWVCLWAFISTTHWKVSWFLLVTFAFIAYMPLALDDGIQILFGTLNFALFSAAYWLLPVYVTGGGRFVITPEGLQRIPDHTMMYESEEEEVPTEIILPDPAE